MTLASSILPLENGDRLTRAEFHARYKQHPEIRRAELIEGVVYVPSPVGKDHGLREASMTTWLGTYAATRSDVDVLSNVTVRLASDTEVQPDIALLRLRPGEAEQPGFVDRAPELIVEIAGSTASYDLHDKMDVYRRNGVGEYVVWRVYERAIDWFELREGQYERLEPDAAGVIESAVFPGLRLPVEKMLDGNVAAVLAEQRRT